MLIIDGSQGEGGGQILRTSLALSLLTGKPFRMVNVRAKRKKPGLLRQHLTAIHAARTVGRAAVEGDALGSAELEFRPGDVSPGSYHFSVGTAGSATLVLQTILPPLLLASGPSTVTVEGGTHNPFAPPYEFLERAFAPVVNRMGPSLKLQLDRHGFYPAGGGRVRAVISPSPRLERIDLVERGEIRGKRGLVIQSALPDHIAHRERNALISKMAFDEESCSIRRVEDSQGPGNVVLVEIESDHVTELFIGFGERGVRAEAVAGQAVDAARRYLTAGVPVGPYLADQLVLPFVLAGGGSFVTVSPSRHTRTSVEVVRLFVDIDLKLEEQGRDRWLFSARAV